MQRLLQDTAVAVLHDESSGTDALHDLCGPLVDALQTAGCNAEIRRRIAQALGVRGVRALLNALQSKSDRTDRVIAHRLLSEVILDEGLGQMLLMQEAGFLMGALWVYFVPHSCAAAVVGADGSSVECSATDPPQPGDKLDQTGVSRESDVRNESADKDTKESGAMSQEEFVSRLAARIEVSGGFHHCQDDMHGALIYPNTGASFDPAQHTLAISLSSRGQRRARWLGLFYKMSTDIDPGRLAEHLKNSTGPPPLPIDTLLASESFCNEWYETHAIGDGTAESLQTMAREALISAAAKTKKTDETSSNSIDNNTSHDGDAREALKSEISWQQLCKIDRWLSWRRPKKTSGNGDSASPPITVTDSAQPTGSKDATEAAIAATPASAATPAVSVTTPTATAASTATDSVATQAVLPVVAATTTAAAAAADSAATQAVAVASAAVTASFDNSLTLSNSAVALENTAAAAGVVATSGPDSTSSIVACLPCFARAPLVTAHARARGLLDAARGNARVGMTVRRCTGGGTGTILNYVDARGTLHGEDASSGDLVVKSDAENDPLDRAPCTALVRWDVTGATCHCAIGYMSTKHQWKTAAKTTGKIDSWDCLLNSPKKKLVSATQAFDLVGSVSEPVTAPGCFVRNRKDIGATGKLAVFVFFNKFCLDIERAFAAARSDIAHLVSTREAMRAAAVARQKGKAVLGKWTVGEAERVGDLLRANGVEALALPAEAADNGPEALYAEAAVWLRCAIAKAVRMCNDAIRDDGGPWKAPSERRIWSDSIRSGANAVQWQLWRSTLLNAVHKSKLFRGHKRAADLLLESVGGVLFPSTTPEDQIFAAAPPELVAEHKLVPLHHPRKRLLRKLRIKHISAVRKIRSLRASMAQTNDRSIASHVTREVRGYNYFKQKQMDAAVRKSQSEHNLSRTHRLAAEEERLSKLKHKLVRARPRTAQPRSLIQFA